MGAAEEERGPRAGEIQVPVPRGLIRGRVQSAQVNTGKDPTPTSQMSGQQQSARRNRTVGWGVSCSGVGAARADMEDKQ